MSTVLLCAHCGKSCGTGWLSDDDRPWIRPVLMATIEDRRLTVIDKTPDIPLRVRAPGVEMRWPCAHCRWQLCLDWADSQKIGHLRRLVIRGSASPTR